jgi:dihydrofolate reductase
VTRNPAYVAARAVVTDSLPKALALTQEDAEVFVIGGSQMYREALPLADRIYLTELQADYPGDAFFPDLAPSEWQASAHERHAAESDQPAWDFAVYERC